MKEETLALLRKLAARNCWDDEFGNDFDVCGYSGGNFDDAYYGGSASGETLLARTILRLEGDSTHELTKQGDV